MAILVWGRYNLDRREEEGEFECPRCGTHSTYVVLRTYRYWHIFFVPLIRDEVIAEVIQCDRCWNRYPITILAPNAPAIHSSFVAAQDAGMSLRDSLGNIVGLTEAARLEILRRQCGGRFGNDVVVRVLPPSTRENEYRVEFDFPLADGRDWIGESRGIPIVVDRRDAPLLLGKTIDFREGRFCDTPAG